MFYFIRHGSTDYSQRNTKIYQGFGVYLSPLSELGVRQIKETARDQRLRGADIIISSPYTRAVQTAAILSKELGADIAIETDLHEWLANKDYIYDDDETAERAYEEYVRCRGVYPECESRAWEDAASIRERVLKVLERYAFYDKVIVACHGAMIQAVTGGELPACGEVAEFDLYRGDKND